MHVNNFKITDNLNGVVFPKQRRFLVAHSTKKPSPCVICGASSKCRHFGAVCCNSCAAFFRRTLSSKKSYSCALNNMCVINFRFARRMCSACRIRKCISAGMKSEIQNQLHTPLLCNSLLPTNTYNMLLLPRLQKFDHSAQFLNYGNNKWLQDLLISTRAIEHQRVTHLPPSPYALRGVSYMPSIPTQFLNEIKLCQMFLGTTDISSFYSDTASEKFTDIVIYWINLISIMNTLQNDSLQHRKLTLFDNSTIEMRESSIRAWYATSPLLHKHLNSVVKVSSPTLFEAADLITKIKNLHMTNEEQAFFLFLGMIRGITRLTSEPKVTRLRFQPLLGTVFRSMHTYYSENFPSDCTATRMGNLIMALPVIDEVNSLFNKLKILASLHYNDPQVSGYLAAFGKEIERTQPEKNLKMVADALFVCSD